MTPTKEQSIEMCQFYGTSGWSGYPPFMPKCEKHRKASLKCHSKRTDCPDYKPSEVGDDINL